MADCNAQFNPLSADSSMRSAPLPAKTPVTRRLPAKSSLMQSRATRRCACSHSPEESCMVGRGFSSPNPRTREQLCTTIGAAFRASLDSMSPFIAQQCCFTSAGIHARSRTVIARWRFSRLTTKHCEQLVNFAFSHSNEGVGVEKPTPRWARPTTRSRISEQVALRMFCATAYVSSRLQLLR